MGVEYKLFPNLGLLVDYVFTDYGSIDTEDSNSFSGTNNDGPDPFSSASVVTSKADVTKSTLTAGVSWYFGGKKAKPAPQMIDK